MVKIRMARAGRVKLPIFTIVATNSRSPRDGKFLQKLGQYRPKEEQVLRDLKLDAIAEWIKKGAILSDTVRSLFKKHKVNLPNL